MADKDLNALFLDTLKDIYYYYAEKQISESLAEWRKLRTPISCALHMHRDETEGQIARLEQICELLEKPARGYVGLRDFR
jgi:ferritin-like metal-binding protein YciE